MAELAATAALGRHSARFEGARLDEVELELVSIALPLGGRDRLAAALAGAWGIGLPDIGRSERTVDGSVTLLGLAADQVFAAGLPVEEVAAAAGNAGYLTEQTGAWAALRLEGRDAVAALERICPLDLHPAALPVGAVARTVMEHLGAVLLREGDERFLLLSARSSARSFLHAVETSIRNVG